MNFPSQYVNTRYTATPVGSATVLEPVNLDDATEATYNYIKENRTEDGQVIVYGYSWGGVLANHLAKRLEKDKIKVSFLITVDAADGPALIKSIGQWVLM